MSPLVRKEIRLILPFWGIALALAIAPACILVSGPFLWFINEAVFWLLGFGLLLLGLAPFGQEFGLGTFSMMLAQPFERRRIWKTKILLVTAAAVLVCLAFIITLHTRIDASISQGAQRVAESQPYPGHIGNMGFVEMQSESLKHLGEAFSNGVEVSLLLLAVAITGGLWSTLLFRQTGAAMWFALLIPGAIIVIVEAVFHNLSPPAEHIVLGTVLGLYSLAGLIWAQRMFASAQDSQWLGETVALLSLSPGKQKAEDIAAPRRKGAFGALVRKELQSHQVSLLVGFGLLVLHLCTLVFRRFDTLPKNSELRFVVEAVPFLWLLLPWLVGSVAVAEERKLGTMESQLCLPVTRRFQFVIKFAVVLLLGFVLGAIMPILLETLGAYFHISSDLLGLSLMHSYLPGPISFFAEHRGIIGMCLGAIFIATASFFASTLCRNSLHALGGGMVWGCAFFFLFQWVMVESNSYEYSIWKGPLIFFTGVPVAVVVVMWLSFSNYKRLHAGRNVWLRNVLTLVVSLVFTGIATAFVYQRPWELAMSLEPQHGAPRLSGPVQPTVCMPNGRMFALLPDGRLWTGADYREKVFDRDVEVWDAMGQSNHLEKLRMYLPASGTFIGGSNWVALAANSVSIEVVALQSDGTLWSVLTREDWTTNRVKWFSLAPHLRRIGADSDWKSVDTSQRYFLALKKDGSLWGWGNNDGRFAPDAREHIPEPVRIGTDSDWAMIFGRYSDPLLMKTNGTIFRFWEDRHQWGLERSNLNGKDWLVVAGSPERDYVIRRDGTLWGRGYLPRVFFGAHQDREFRRVEFMRIGDRSDWALISGSYSSVVAIRKDGSLVKNEMAWFSSTFGQPSRYSDWIAADMDWNGILALASDGTLSWWVDTRYRPEFLLAPSHRPLWSENIFSEVKN